jgi:hypothetical protein
MGTKTNTNFSKPSVLTEDYQLCNMCNRKYNEQAFGKHLPTCERRTKEANMKAKSKNALMPQNSLNTNNTLSHQSKPTVSQTTNFSSKPNLNVRFYKK